MNVAIRREKVTTRQSHEILSQKDLGKTQYILMSIFKDNFDYQPQVWRDSLTISAFFTFEGDEISETTGIMTTLKSGNEIPTTLRSAKDCTGNEYLSIFCHRSSIPCRDLGLAVYRVLSVPVARARSSFSDLVPPNGFWKDPSEPLDESKYVVKSSEGMFRRPTTKLEMESDLDYKPFIGMSWHWKLHRMPWCCWKGNERRFQATARRLSLMVAKAALRKISVQV